MARIVEQNNTWGSTGPNSPNAQRSDLWQISTDLVVKGLNSQIFDEGLPFEGVPAIPAYYAQSVTLPELKVGSETYRRDSRPYQMPSFDDACGGVRIMFYVDTQVDAARSNIYQLCDTWRAFVRSGRGGMTEEGAVDLGPNYRRDYRFSLKLTLLKGASNFQITQVSQGVTPPSIQALLNELNTQPDADQDTRMSALISKFGVGEAPSLVTNDMEIAGVYSLDNAWLSSFRLTELTYAVGNQLTMLEAQIFAENIRDLSA